MLKFLLFLILIFSSTAHGAEEIRLPRPERDGSISVEKAISVRRSVREFADNPITLQELSQLLWAAGGSTIDGITGPTRSYPSAGAIYPNDIYIVAGNVKGLSPGVYKYNWRRHYITMVRNGDLREELYKAALSQRVVKEAPATIVITALYAKIAKVYGQRGVIRYVSMDAGHMGQNVSLQAQSLGLGTVMIGAFIDGEVAETIGIKDGKPIYIMSIGKPKK